MQKSKEKRLIIEKNRCQERVSLNRAAIFKGDLSFIVMKSI